MHSTREARSLARPQAVWPLAPMTDSWDSRYGSRTPQCWRRLQDVWRSSSRQPAQQNATQVHRRTLRLATPTRPEIERVAVSLANPPHCHGLIFNCNDISKSHHDGRGQKAAPIPGAQLQLIIRLDSCTVNQKFHADYTSGRLGIR